MYNKSRRRITLLLSGDSGESPNVLSCGLEPSNYTELSHMCPLTPARITKSSSSIVFVHQIKLLDIDSLDH